MIPSQSDTTPGGHESFRDVSGSSMSVRDQDIPNSQRNQSNGKHIRTTHKFGRLGTLSSNPRRASPVTVTQRLTSTSKSPGGSVIDLTLSDDDSPAIPGDNIPETDTGSTKDLQRQFDSKESSVTNRASVSGSDTSSGFHTADPASEDSNNAKAVEVESSDDDIMEIDPDEAAKLEIFKANEARRIHQQRQQQMPAPVPHFPPGSSEIRNLQMKIQERYRLLENSKEELASAVRRRNNARGLLSRALQAQRDNERIREQNSEKASDPEELKRSLIQAHYQLQVTQTDVNRSENRIRTVHHVILQEQQHLNALVQQQQQQQQQHASGDDEREALRKRYRADHSMLGLPPNGAPKIEGQSVYGGMNPAQAYPQMQGSNYNTGFQSTALQGYNMHVPAQDFFSFAQNDVNPYDQPAVTQTQNQLGNLDEASHLKDLLDNIRPEDEDNEDDSGLPPRPEGMRSDLYKHQKMGLAWLMRMEESKSKGGLLADDMGLGKTIQTIALIMARKSDDPTMKTTLIIAPVSLLRQWSNEIKLHTTGVSVGIYHGVHKAKQFRTFADLSRFDVIMTSYTTLGNEFKKHYEKLYEDNELKITSNILPDHGLGGERYCSPFYEPGSKFYRVVLDEAQNIKNKLTVSCKAVTTLDAEYRLCLTGTPMQNTVDELFPIIRFLRIKPYSSEEKFKSNISVPLKSNDADDYEKNRSMNRLRALLRAILLRRNKKSEIDGKPILNLPDKHVSDITVSMGEEELETYKSIETQLQTRAKKLFLQDSNFSNFLVLLLRLRQASCHTFLCELGSVGKFEQFRVDNWERLYNAVEKLSAEDKEAILKDLEQCIDKGAGKTIEAGDKDFKAEEVGSDDDIELIELLSSQNGSTQSGANPDGITRERKEAVEDDLNKEVVEFAKGQGQLSQQRHIENWEPIKEDSKEDVKPEVEDIEMDLEKFKTDEGGVFTCSLCFIDYTFESAISFPCKHKVCEDCIDSFIEDNKVDERSVKCFDCNTIFPNNKFIDYKMFKLRAIEHKSKLEIKNYVEENFKGKLSVSEKIKKLIVKHQGFEYSTKMAEALKLIQKILVEHPGEKIILFSQFTSFFELLKVMFNKSGIPTLRYDGTMSLEKKDLTIQQFYQNDRYRLMMTSLKAGNVGLTLNCASHVIIMDPFWNPYVEEQAQDRAHRIGQKREVYVYRILISNTVEERIVNLQNKKKALINAAMDENGIKSVSRLSRQDLRYLFGL